MTRRPGRMFRVAGAAAVTALLLGACAPSEPESDAERGIVVTGQALPEATVEQTMLPFAFQELPTYTLPFDVVPQALDGVLFGLREGEGVLEFAAVSTAGQVLWTTQRPATCSGYTLTRSGQTPLAILTDVRAGDGALETTASAYHLRTGDLAWGPVPVAGPWHGPGTVFAQAAPASAMGAVGEREVLDPASGKVLDTGQVIGEFFGTILTLEGEHVIARGANEWSLQLSDLPRGGAAAPATVAALPGSLPPEGYALLALDGSDTGVVIDVAAGSVVTQGASSAAFDAAAGTLIVREGETLAGYGAEGPMWNRAIGAEMRISASGGVLTYLRSDTAVQVVNAVTGDDAVGYSPEATTYTIPAVISPDGAAVFSLDNLVLVGTHPMEPEG